LYNFTFIFVLSYHRHLIGIKVNLLRAKTMDSGVITSTIIDKVHKCPLKNTQTVGHTHTHTKWLQKTFK